MICRSVVFALVTINTAWAQVGCPTAVLKANGGSIEIFGDADLAQSLGRIDSSQVVANTPIMACRGSIAFRIVLGAESFWVRRTNVRIQPTGSQGLVPSSKTVPFSAGGRGMFE